MPTSRVTVTLGDSDLTKIRALVAAGESPNVSAFVQHAIRIALNDAANWKQMLDQAIGKTGGPLTKKERAWADGILGMTKRKRRSGK